MRSIFRPSRWLLVFALSLTACDGASRVTGSSTVASIEVTPADASVDALGTTTSFGVVLRDGSGNPVDVAAHQIEWTSDQSSVAVVDQDGIATAIGNGQATITARVGNVTGSATFSVQQTASTISLTPGTLLLEALEAQAGLVATVRDAGGNPVPAGTVEWSSQDISVAVVDADGVVTAVAPGSTQIIASSGPASNLVVVNVVPVPSRISVVQQPTTSLTSGSTMPIQPRVRLVDANSHPVNVSGITVTVTAEPTGASVAGVASVETDAQGVATFSGLSLVGTAGTYQLRFRSPALTAAFSANITLSPGSASSMTKVGGDMQSAAPGSAVAVTPKVLVRDAGGNPVAGASVIFAVTSGGGSVTGASATTNANGHAAVGSWTLGNTLGVNTLTANAAGVDAVTFEATAVAGAAARLILVTAPSDTTIIGVPLQTQPVLRLVDALGHHVLQSGVVVTVTVSGGCGTLDGTTTVSTDATGTATFTNLSLNDASGSQVVSFQAPGLGGVTAPVQVLGPPAATDDLVLSESAPGDPLHTALNTALVVAAGGNALTANDLLSGGATLTHFGAVQVNDGAGTLGAASGTVTSYPAGSVIPIGADGSLQVNGNGSFTFTPPTNYTGLFRFQYRLTNAAGTDDATVTLAVGVRPEAVADSFSVLGNVPITVPGASGLFANDQGDRVVYVGASHTSGTAGTLSIGVSTGALSYTPSAGYQGTDVYTYTVRNGFGSSQGTLTLAIGGMIWFVDENAVAAGNGRLPSPFRTLGEFVAAGGGSAGDAIFLYESAATYTGGLTLKNNQRLIGQDASSSLASVAGVTVPTHSVPLPAMNPGAGAATVLTGASGGVQLASGNRLHGLRIEVSSGTALQGTSYGTLVVRDASVESDAAAIALSGGTLDAQLTSTTSRGGTTGVSIASSAGSITLGSGSIAGATGAGLYLNGGSATVTYSGTISNTTGYGVHIENGTSGSVSLSGAIMASAAGINVSGDSRVVTFSGGVAVSNPTGTGINIDRGILRVSGQTTITNPAGVGIDIYNPRGKVSFGNVTISGRSGTGIHISTATDSITFGAVVMNNSGSSAASPVSVDNASRVIFAGAHDIDLNHAGTTGNEGFTIQSATVEIDGGTIRNTGGRALSVNGAYLRLTNFTIAGTGNRGILMSYGQLDISNSTFEDIGSNAIYLVANGLEHRLRIVNSTIGTTLGAVTNGYAIETVAPIVSIVLDDVTFGPRKDGSVRAAPIANVGSGVCIALRNLAPQAPLHDPEYVFDGTSGVVRFEEPLVGVVGVVSKTNVTDVAAGSCPVPLF